MFTIKVVSGKFSSHGMQDTSIVACQEVQTVGDRLNYQKLDGSWVHENFNEFYRVYVMNEVGATVSTYEGLGPKYGPEATPLDKEKSD